jgi:hypothetical protein
MSKATIAKTICYRCGLLRCCYYRHPVLYSERLCRPCFEFAVKGALLERVEVKVKKVVYDDVFVFANVVYTDDEKVNVALESCLNIDMPFEHKMEMVMRCVV